MCTQLHINIYTCTSWCEQINSCIGSSVDSLDGSDGLATGLELSHVVLSHSFNSWDEMEGSSEWRDILNSGGSARHEMVPVIHCDLGIS